MSQTSEETSVDISNLIESNIYRVKHLVDVDEVLSSYESRPVSLHTTTPLHEIMSLASSMIENDRLSSSIEDSVQGHATRIAILALAIKTGWVPDPILFNADGKLVDGLHRLTALKLLNVTQTKAVTFVDQIPQSPISIAQHHVFGLLLNSSLFSTEQLASVQTSFRNARGYARTRLLDVLSEDFALRCSDEIAQLDWQRLETSSFSKDVAHISKDGELPPNVTQLAKLLTSDEFRDLMRQISGNHLLEVPTLFLNRLSSNDHIGLHNDYHPKKETLRCVLYLGSTNEPTIFGSFVAVGFNTSPSILDFYSPIHNSLVMFEIGPFSYHLVTPNNNALRYSIILSYFEKIL